MRRRRHFPKHERRDAGGAPGQVRPARHSAPTVIDIIAYGPEDFVEKHKASVDDVRALHSQHPVVWVNVTGLASVDVITQLGSIFGLHQLALEDVVNTHQRPKVEEYDDYLFFVLRMLQVGSVSDTEQMAMFLGETYLVTFQETPGDCLHSLRGRVRGGKGRVRNLGADYLCYAIIDSVIDFYFPALETLGEMLESLEDRVVSKPASTQITEIHDMKRSLLMLRRSVWPHREMLNELIRDEHPFIRETTRPFLRDCYDHTIQLMDVVETYREIAYGLLDVYISSVSARLNEIMKVLTLIATIFMPLGFIASLYGMNFDRSSPWNMPELGWRYGYPLALTLMGASAFGLIWYFRSKGWLFNDVDRSDRNK